jgi:hypothetical protein
MLLISELRHQRIAFPKAAESRTCGTFGCSFLLVTFLLSKQKKSKKTGLATPCSTSLWWLPCEVSSLTWLSAKLSAWQSSFVVLISFLTVLIVSCR